MEGAPAAAARMTPQRHSVVLSSEQRRAPDGPISNAVGRTRLPGGSDERRPPNVTSLLAGLMLTTASAVYAQQLPVRIYTTVDGLAHDHVRRIVLDSRGFLWFCTMQGLNR